MTRDTGPANLELMGSLPLAVPNMHAAPAPMVSGPGSGTPDPGKAADGSDRRFDPAYLNATLTAIVSGHRQSRIDDAVALVEIKSNLAPKTNVRPRGDKTV